MSKPKTGGGVGTNQYAIRGHATRHDHPPVHAEAWEIRDAQLRTAQDIYGEEADRAVHGVIASRSHPLPIPRSVYGFRILNINHDHPASQVTFELGGDGRYTARRGPTPNTWDWDDYQYAPTEIRARGLAGLLGRTRTVDGPEQAREREMRRYFVDRVLGVLHDGQVAMGEADAELKGIAVSASVNQYARDAIARRASEFAERD